MKSRILPSEFLGWQTLLAPWASCLTIAFLSVAVAAPARSQQPPHPTESITEAARNAREQKSNSTNHPVVFTNDDVAARNSTPGASPPPPATSSSTPASSSSINRAEAPKPQTAGCDNPNAEKLKADLQAAAEERDQLRRELSDQPTVISNGDVDLTNFKPSSSGLNVGAPPLLQTQPEAPTRVAEVILEEKISSLKKSLTIACEPPKEAGTRGTSIKQSKSYTFCSASSLWTRTLTIPSPITPETPPAKPGSMRNSSGFRTSSLRYSA